MLVQHEGERYKVKSMLSVDSVLGEHVQTAKIERLRIELLKIVSEEAEEAQPERDLEQLSEEEWELAQTRFQAIKPLLDVPIRSREAAEALAKKAGVHVATLYRWLKLYQEAGHVAALVSSKRGRKKGEFFLTEEQEKIVESVLDVPNNQRPKPVDVIEEVQRRCRVAKVKAPHPNTIRLRVSLLHPAKKLRNRGQADIAQNMYGPIKGKFPGALHPFSLVQIDHTQADIILVDDVMRQPLTRPWVTLAIDVWSRMVAGLYISFERPSAASVGLCLARAICPKREYLAELGVGGEWSVWGRIGVVHCDNAKEFRGRVLAKGAKLYTSDLQWRPVKLPHYGGHIERLMGEVSNVTRKMPGATFSNTKLRMGYDSEKESAMTLREFEAYFVDFIVNYYHQRLHTGINMSPKRKWELGILGDDSSPGIGILPIPEDPLRVQLDFMPFFERSVQRYGIQIDHIHYYHPCLDPYINSMDPKDNRRKRQFLVRRDPRDISKIYFLDPADDRYTEIPYANITYPAMSQWELKEILKKLKEEGREDIDENLIFETLDRLRQRIEDAKAKTKKARRQATRIPPKKPTEKVPATTSNVTERVVVSKVTNVDDDPFATPTLPFEDRKVRR